MGPELRGYEYLLRGVASAEEIAKNDDKLNGGHWWQPAHPYGCGRLASHKDLAPELGALVKKMLGPGKAKCYARARRWPGR